MLTSVHRLMHLETTNTTVMFYGTIGAHNTVDEVSGFTFIHPLIDCVETFATSVHLPTLKLPGRHPTGEHDV